MRWNLDNNIFILFYCWQCVKINSVRWFSTEIKAEDKRNLLQHYCASTCTSQHKNQAVGETCVCLCCRRQSHCGRWELDRFATSRKDKIVIVRSVLHLPTPNNSSFPFIPHLSCSQSLSWAAHTKLMLQHVDKALSVFCWQRQSLFSFFSSHFSAEMRLYWL